MDDKSYSYLDRNVGEIRKKIKIAAARAGRDEKDILLMSAVKSAEADEINYIHKALGVSHIGENRVQQLLERWDKLDKKGMTVHFIGSLQTNKVKYIIDKVDLIHSLDSERLAAEIDKQAKKHSLIANVLVEINSGNEESKGGIEYGDAEEFCKSLAKYDNIKLCGFMTMAPKCEKKEEYCKYFSKTYQLVLDIWTKKLHNIDVPVISMGMSESYEEAILEGSNLIRVGRTLFVK